MSGKPSQVRLDVIELANRLWVETFQPLGIVPTVRQVFYQVAVAGLVPKSEKGYRQILRWLRVARMEGDLPWESISDGLRELNTPSTWSTLSDFASDVRGSWKLDRWESQPRSVEVWVEKHTVVGTIDAIIRRYYVPMLCCRGYASSTAKHDAALRAIDRPTTVIYIGDHDPSGVDMLEEAAGWLRSFGAEDVRWDRIAVTADDLDDPELPKLQVNGQDNRTRAYIKRFGTDVLEVEALPPGMLQSRLQDAIRRHLDLDAWDAAVARERDMGRQLGDVIEELEEDGR